MCSCVLMPGLYLRFHEADDLDPLPTLHHSSHRTESLLYYHRPIRDSIRICVPIRMYIFLPVNFAASSHLFENLPLDSHQLSGLVTLQSGAIQLPRPTTSYCLFAFHATNPMRPTIQRGENRSVDLKMTDRRVTATAADEMEATAAGLCFRVVQQPRGRCICHTYRLSLRLATWTRIHSGVGSSATDYAGGRKGGDNEKPAQIGRAHV